MGHNEVRDQWSVRRGTVEARKRWRMRPTLMALEDRRLLSTIIVNNPTDTPVMGKTDLRQTIDQAKLHRDDQTIVFDKTVFKTPQTITLGGTQLELTDTTGKEKILGPAVGVTVSGNKASRVFQVDGGVTASISGLTITGGNAGDSSGGGLLNNGTTTLTDCTVSGNSVTRRGHSATGSGGGLANLAAKLTLTDCTVSGNHAGLRGGALYTNFGGKSMLTDCTVSGNSAVAGGGIYNNDMLNVSSCIIMKNQATSQGGGISTAGGRATIAGSLINKNQLNSSGTAQGGGIFSDNTLLSLTNCTVNDSASTGYDNYYSG